MNVAHVREPGPVVTLRIDRLGELRTPIAETTGGRPMTERPAHPGPTGGADPSSVWIDRMRPGHWPAVRTIYEAGIATGNATFEREAPEWDAWDRGHRPDCRLVAVDGERVLGWVALSPTSSRRVYEGVAWVNIYVAQDARGRGVGRALLQAVVEASEVTGIWTLQAAILAENAASLALHRRVGFRRVGVQERLGRDATGRWRDVVLMERRSEAANG